MIPTAVSAPASLGTPSTIRTTATVSAAAPAIVSYALPMIGISSAVTMIAAAGIAMLISKQSISPFATTHLFTQRLDAGTTALKLTPAPFDFAA